MDARTAAARVAAVVAVDESFLALELIASAAPARGFDEALGRGLAALHRFGAPGFGLDHDNFVGRLPQDNRPVPGGAGGGGGPGAWAAFYGERRLGAQLARAVASGLASARMKRGFERLLGALPELCGPDEPPARLH